MHSMTRVASIVQKHYKLFYHLIYDSWPGRWHWASYTCREICTPTTLSPCEDAPKYSSSTLPRLVHSSLHITILCHADKSTAGISSLFEQLVSGFLRKKKTKKKLIKSVSKFQVAPSVTRYRPAMPFGTRKIYFRGSFLFNVVTI